jgi:hypothetical protein
MHAYAAISGVRGVRDIIGEIPRASRFSKRGKWENSILDYLLQARRTSPDLSMSQLEKIGFAYCLERRPAGF